MKEFTTDEKAIARNIDKRYKWMARDKLGNLFVFNQKPRKSFSGVWICESMKWDDMFVFNEMFKSITWEDDEPTLIRDIYVPQILDDAPAPARWKKAGSYGCCCSICGQRVRIKNGESPRLKSFYKYCPNCGAKMNKEEKQ